MDWIRPKTRQKAKRPAYAFAYSVGLIGALLLGVGMCLSMKVIGDGSLPILILGVAIGLIGIVMVSISYPLYSKILRMRKEKYASEILLALNNNKE